jgi:PIN domain nuclease of toxin-antitoxin system
MRAELLRAGLIELDITGGIALDAAGLRGCSDDPFDRLIMAAARATRATLVTSDERILGWAGELDRVDARL